MKRFYIAIIIFVLPIFIFMGGGGNVCEVVAEYL